MEQKDMSQEEMNDTYSKGREYIESLFEDGKAVEKPFMWGVFDSLAMIIADCGFEEAFNEALEWARERRR